MKCIKRDDDSSKNLTDYYNIIEMVKEVGLCKLLGIFQIGPRLYEDDGI